jgi:CDP-diacylglycerol--serine O-phosphatidyltransferase
MPTLVTLGNLVAGFAAIHFASKPIDSAGIFQWSSLTVAGALVFLGMFFDAIDGSIARLTRTSSDLGAQLDSLADIVTFGVAPAFMMLRLVSTHVAESGTIILGPEADLTLAKIPWGIAAVYVCCTGLRLARFNVETPSSARQSHMVFRGLPSPGAAGAVASLIVLHQHWLSPLGGVISAEPGLAVAWWTALGIPLATLLCAIAMVSSIPYVHFVNRYLGGRRSFAYVARLVIPLFLAIWWFQEMLALLFTVYAVGSPLRLLIARLRGRRRPMPVDGGG